MNYDDPVKRCTRKYSTEYYLKSFLELLSKVTTYRAFGYYSSKAGSPDNHYSTVAKKFRFLANQGTFQDAFQEILLKFIVKDEYNKCLQVYLDGTHIENRYGLDCIGKGEYPKKNTTKLTFCCDTNKNILGVQIYSGNIHDVHTIEPAVTGILDNLDIKAEKEYKINLGADKGYIARKELVDDPVPFGESLKRCSLCSLIDY